MGYVIGIFPDTGPARKKILILNENLKFVTDGLH